ncbi:MAG: hypothetical protein ACP6KW_01220 [Candidatus Thorarchaeota archaeon]
MQYLQSTLWMAFIVALTALFLISRTVKKSKARRDLRRAVVRNWTVHEFLTLREKRRDLRGLILLQEQTVVSLTNRYTGRFDAAVVHRNADGAVLDVVLERKFPATHIPESARSEDIFQAGLYALAMKERGFRCDTTRLAVVYCLQETAEACLNQNSRRSCWECSRGRFFEREFKPKLVLKQIRRLNEVWYGKRKPRKASTPERCRPCPHSKSGRCNYAVV